MSGLDITATVDSRPSFRDAVRAAEQEAGVEPFVPADQPTPGGPTAPAEAAPAEPVAAEPEPAKPDAAAAEPEAEPLLAGKYKTVEDLERGYGEMVDLLNRQGAEVGELRRAYDERFAELERQRNEDIGAQRRVQVTPDLIETNPAYAAQVAYEQRDQATLQVAFEQWRSLDEGAANLWLAQAQAQEREQQLRAEYDAKLAAFEERIRPLAQASETDELRRGVEQLPAETKAFLADEQAVQALANEFPSIGKGVVSGAPAERLEAVKALYEIQRGRTADTLATSTQEVARATAVEAQQTRDDAYVTSATAASQEEPKTREQIEQEAAVAAFTRRSAPNFGGGLVRPGKQ